MTHTPTGLVAILRGLTPQEAPEVGDRLYAAGFRALEVPLNSPDPLTSVRVLRENLPQDCAVGAGTVLTVEEVRAAHAAGAGLVVSPAMDPEVIAETVGLGMRSYPGVTTPTEAFAALRAGARSLKLFPSEAVGIAGMTAWRAVLPADVEFLPVGGVDAGNLRDWVAAGAGGAGIGSSLYRPGVSGPDLSARAEALVRAWRSASDHPEN
ncbi:2-dehydro-3-deoxy-6-phosphogalactonate aldolase [Kocuria turfanensis]|uniref:2-dehydro-3-deoxy-6-phosphogalactonate aldolase n=1 Tax=Kocuria turfanensis TaxID=388357 RepID=A0A512IGR9_9MICC|nr:2-dehydro-3-deoxy-6-phosphogalactonate aldolase [Kocuria turfanensis]GEO96858.1 2-dehydro-3-deoxy-6-phosphogalactonate aldolase [Kocuria turfanensis]